MASQLPAAGPIVAIGLAVLVSGCFLNRSAEERPPCSSDLDCEVGGTCFRGFCVWLDASATDGGPRDAGRDAGPDDGGLDAGSDSGLDAGVDAGTDAGTDAGPSPHCADGVPNFGETATDCGGECPGCDLCQPCSVGSDCAVGNCRAGLCRREFTRIRTDLGLERWAYVREDGAVLLAYYEPAAYNVAYDTTSLQRVAADGGGPGSSEWAPDPCTESGHLPFSEFSPVSRQVTMECGPSGADIEYRTSSAMFASFASGVQGTVSAAGEPGWAAIASIGSGAGRGNHAMCGSMPNTITGGIAYCDGAGVGGSFANHLVSFTCATTAGWNYVGCGRTGCQGAACPLAVWVWLRR